MSATASEPGSGVLGPLAIHATLRTVGSFATEAVLALLGGKVNALAPRRWRARSEAADAVEQSGGWYRLSHFVMRRPAMAMSTRPVITHSFPMAEFATGFELIRSGQCGKVVLIP